MVYRAMYCFFKNGIAGFIEDRIELYIQRPGGFSGAKPRRISLIKDSGRSRDSGIL